MHEYIYTRNICMHIYIYICTSDTCMNIYIYTYTYTYIHIHPIHAWISTPNICINIVYVIYACIHVQLIYACIYIYLHLIMHEYMCIYVIYAWICLHRIHASMHLHQITYEYMYMQYMHACMSVLEVCGIWGVLCRSWITYSVSTYPIELCQVMFSCIFFHSDALLASWRWSAPRGSMCCVNVTILLYDCIYHETQLYVRINFLRVGPGTSGSSRGRGTWDTSWIHIRFYLLDRRPPGSARKSPNPGN